MGQTMPDRVSMRTLVDLKLEGARFQISTLSSLNSGAEHHDVAAESCVDAATDQMLQALKAALHQFNLLLPDPLPSSRVSRRNLRDHFYAVQSDSSVLREIENASRANEGWLWWLEEKHDGSVVAPLLRRSVDAGTRILRDPLDPEAGVEDMPAEEYLKQSLAQISGLIDQMFDQMPEDVTRYREAQRQQSRRLM